MPFKSIHMWVIIRLVSLPTSLKIEKHQAFSQFESCHPHAVIVPAFGENRNVAVSYIVDLLIHSSTSVYLAYINRLSAVSKATGRSNGGPQLFRIFSSVYGGIRGFAALERGFASRGETAARDPCSRAPSSSRLCLSRSGR